MAAEAATEARGFRAALEAGAARGAGDPPPVTRPILPHAAAAQVALAIRDIAPGRTELQLRPEELGRIGLHVITEEGRLTVHVTAERPETLDMIRRSIDRLDQDLRQSGFGPVSYRFGEGGGQDRPDHPARAAPPPPPATGESPAPVPVPARPQAPGLSHLDLRM
ncbi:flagellar hook-length control protein FliK [Wenxinia saemankumensis]|uniref:flagellar hook-length control protein FliK n=1 Tax=Wenxinia saemankumensis TaxID=1447782 RepID=UPI00147C7C10|nr:flagellar hook-length control protein FliK [Wenxinia saemankumensis]